MSSEADETARPETIVSVITALRETSASSVMYSQATADKAGLHSTDMECLDHLILRGQMTAGKLCELTGLSSGTMTALIDRLERAGYVRRERGTRDRRQVLVVPVEEKINEDLAPITQPLGAAVYAALEGYSEQELQLILRFLDGANAIALEAITALLRRDSAEEQSANIEGASPGEGLTG
jgi:DNA-binding MarR family transcriptional regulator